MNQVAPVRTELPDTIVARVVDASGKPIAGQLVSFVVMNGGGHAFTGTAVTDARGEVRERWRLGDTASIQVLEVRAIDPKTRARIVFARVEAIAEPATVDTLLLRSADTIVFVRQKIVLPHLVSRISDRFGNVAPFNRVTVVLAPGWSRSADTIWATAEGAVTAAFSAGSQRKVIRLRAIEDLRPYRWRISFACAGAMLTSDFASARIDSVDVKAVVEDVLYRGYPGFRTDASHWINLQVIGTRQDVRWFASGTVDTVSSRYEDYFTQRPDSLASWSFAEGVSLRTSAVPPRYEGGERCREKFFGSPSTLRAPVVQMELR